MPGEGSGRLRPCKLLELFIGVRFHPGSKWWRPSSWFLGSDPGPLPAEFQKGAKVLLVIAYRCDQAVSGVDIEVQHEGEDGRRTKRFFRGQTLPAGVHRGADAKALELRAGEGESYTVTFRTTDGGEMVGRLRTTRTGSGRWRSHRVRFH